MCDVIDINIKRDILTDDYRLKHHLKYNFIESQLGFFVVCKIAIDRAVKAELKGDDYDYSNEIACLDGTKITLHKWIECFRLWDLIEIKLNKVRKI